MEDITDYTYKVRDKHWFQKFVGYTYERANSKTINEQEVNYVDYKTDIINAEDVQDLSVLSMLYPAFFRLVRESVNFNNYKYKIINS